MNRCSALLIYLLLLAAPLQAGWDYVCWYTYSEVTSTVWVGGHQEYDEYTGDYVDVPGGYETYVTGTWTPECTWIYTPDPQPTPPTSPPPGNQPPIILPASIWVDSADVTDPDAIVTTVAVRPASDTACDINEVREFVGYLDHETLYGPFPYSFQMGHVRLSDLPIGQTRIQFDGFDPCNGFIGSTNFNVSRNNGSRNTSNVITVSYLDQSDDVPVPVINGYGRTFAQDYVETSFDVTTQGAESVRYQLTAANDAIQFGDWLSWPGSPLYAEEWTATGTSLGTFSEQMRLVGFSTFDGTQSYQRTQYYGPAFGFEPQVSATIHQFQWYTPAGLVTCFITGDTASMTIWPH